MFTGIKVLTVDNFREYGTVIEPTRDNVGGRDFEIILTIPSSGWRIATLKLVKDEFTFMERHLKTKETHEPLSGIAIILVSKPESPENIDVFLLDKPLCVNEGIWHQVMAISESAMIKIVENIVVPNYESEVFFLEDGVNVSASIEMKKNSIKVPEK